MPFATGFFLIAPDYRSPEHYQRILKALREMGFEVYETDNPAYIIFYVEAPDVNSLDKGIRMGESVEGVAKAFVVWGFLADDAAREELERMLENGEISLTEEAKKYFEHVLKSI